MSGGSSKSLFLLLASSSLNENYNYFIRPIINIVITECFAMAKLVFNSNPLIHFSFIALAFVVNFTLNIMSPLKT
jgi:hypothetical protein